MRPERCKAVLQIRGDVNPESIGALPLLARVLQLQRWVGMRLDGGPRLLLGRERE